MSHEERTLLVLPIHRRSERRYWADYKRYYDRKCREQLRPNNLLRIPRHHWTQYFSWGVWMHNDVLGWLEVKWDGGNRFGGEIYLRWQCLPRTARMPDAAGERKVGRNPRLVDRKCVAAPHLHDVMRDIEIYPRYVILSDNQNCVEVLDQIVSEARCHVRRRFGAAEIWLPPFGLECINWVEAIRQAGAQAGRRPTVKRARGGQ